MQHITHILSFSLFLKQFKQKKTFVYVRPFSVIAVTAHAVLLMLTNNSRYHRKSEYSASTASMFRPFPICGLATIKIESLTWLTPCCQ